MEDVFVPTFNYALHDMMSSINQYIIFHDSLHKNIIIVQN